MENVQILFVRMPRQSFPDRTTEVTAPVAWQFAFFFVGNVEEIAVFSVRIFAGFLEPLMFIRTVVYYEIQKNIHITFLCLGKKTVHVFQCSENRIDVVIIRDVVSLIGKRRRIAWGNPYNVDTQSFQIV